MNKKMIMPFDIKKMDDEEGTFEGYGSVFGTVDSYNEVIVRGAFKETLSNRKSSTIKMLWQHNTNEPIGVYDEIEEDEKGLYVRGRLLKNEVNRAKEAYALLKNGALDGLSIGFRVNSGGSRIGEDGITYLNSIKLYEISLVTFPANGDALVSAVKNINIAESIKNIRDYEEFLRDAGFSRSQATALASKGYKAIDQSESDDVAVLNAINSLKQTLEDFKNGSRAKTSS